MLFLLFTGFIYANQNWTTCFNVTAEKNSVCESHGRCVADDVCYCWPGWRGEMCTEWFCSENCIGGSYCIGANECGWNCSIECQEHAFCKEDKCVCELGYKGKECTFSTFWLGMGLFIGCASLFVVLFILASFGWVILWYFCERKLFSSVKYQKKVRFQTDDGSTWNYTKFNQGVNEKTGKKTITVDVNDEVINDMFGTKREMKTKN